jgi:tRNA (cytidine/uridine-2'-O-)-methyltransferase
MDDSSASNPSPHFHIVLHQPEIPNNTGNIGRTCVATGCALHLVHPLGFDTDEKACRRAGLDYWPRLGVREHADWEACVDALAQNGPPRLWLLSTRATRCVWDVDLQLGDALVFGRETTGLPDEILDRYPDRGLRLPMMPGERSLNQAVSVCTVVYEGLRQARSRSEIRLDDRFCFHPTTRG